MNINNCGRRNVRKNREIKGSDKYVTLDIPLKFGSLDKIRITSSATKNHLGKSGKGLITSLDPKDKAGPKKSQRDKKASYAIGNISKKDLSNFIKDFENLPFKIYERGRPKHEPTDSSFYLTRQLHKCMIRSDALNLYIYSVRMEITAAEYILILHVCSTNDSKLEEFLVNKTLS